MYVIIAKRAELNGLTRRISELHCLEASHVRQVMEDKACELIRQGRTFTYLPGELPLLTADRGESWTVSKLVKGATLERTA